MFNDILYKNNNDALIIFLNKFLNIGFDVNSKEIILNIIQINCNIHHLSILILIKKSCNEIGEEIFSILKYIQNIKFIHAVEKIEIIFRHILKEINVSNYKNNEDIKTIIYSFFKTFTDVKTINECLKQKDFKYETALHKCFYELISILVKLSGNFFISKEFFERILIYLNIIKSGKQINYIFKALFFEFYNTNDTNDNSLNYIENQGYVGLNKYSIKQINQDLYKYLSNLIDFLLKVNPTKEIIIELLYFLEKIYTQYEKNKDNKNSIWICQFVHIFNNKRIISGIFQLISEYQKNILINSQNRKYYFKEDFNDYEKIISIFFYNIKSPGFLHVIKNNLKDENNFSQKMCFLDEIINSIYPKDNNKIIDLNKNKIFYQNILELIEILFSANSFNPNLIKDSNYENIFVNYFYFLKQNKYLFSPYLLVIDGNNKTILEYCLDLSIKIGFENFNKLFLEDKFISDFISKNKIKEKDYVNEEFNEYLKSLKFHLNTRPLIIYMIEVLYEKKGINVNFEKNLTIFISEIKKNEVWTKYQKDNEEIKIIKKLIEPNYSELINYFKRKNKAKEIKVKKSNKVLDNKEVECSLKKKCLLIQKDIIIKNNISINSKMF